MVTLLNSEQGTVVNIDDVQVGDVIDIVKITAAAQWYTVAGLDLSERMAFGIPIVHPRRRHA
jgi:DUF917 family protein